MSEEIVTFHFCYLNVLYELKIKLSLDVFGLILNIKNELKLDKSDDLVILCPVPDGKMVEIQSNEDFEFLKNNKLAYDAVNKEIYCSVELVINIIHKVPDDQKAMFKNLWNKLDNLESKVDKLLETLKKIMDENDSNVISSTVRSILAENSQVDLGNTSNEKSLGEPSKLSLQNLEPKDSLHQNKTKKGEDKFSSISTSDTSNNSTTLLENSGRLDKSPISNVYDTDILLAKLLEEGYTNKIQNIIVVKRFDNNYEKVVSYLKSKAK